MKYERDRERLLHHQTLNNYQHVEQADSKLRMRGEAAE
jgi:hypothetical protein